jgi:hypothetical protein
MGMKSMERVLHPRRRAISGGILLPLASWFATRFASPALPFFCRAIPFASLGTLSVSRGLRFFCRVKLFSGLVLLSVSHGILNTCRGMLFPIPAVVKFCHGMLFFCHGCLFSTTYAKFIYPPAIAGQKTPLFFQTAKYTKSNSIMKKNLLFQVMGLAIALCAGIQQARAQYGQVYFDNAANYPAGAITDASQLGSPPATSFAATLYRIPANPHIPATAVATTTSVEPGFFDGGLVSVLTIPPNQTVSLQIRAWYPTSYATYEAATNSGDLNVRVGVSTIVAVTLGSDGNTAPEPAQFGGFSLQRLGASATGSLQVSITPAGAVNAGAQWRVDNGSWQNNGATVPGLSVGAHGVNFKTVTGWLVPETQNMSVWVAANQTTSVNGDYPQSGLQVFITPAAVAGGNSWRVDGGSWYPNGVAIGISAGLHTVNFWPASNWNTPADQVVTCSGGIVSTVTGAYKPNAAIAPDAKTGVTTNGFGMNFTGTSGQTFVVEASTNMVNWVPLQTNTLTSGAIHFSDLQWTNYPGRYYRLRWQ